MLPIIRHSCMDPDKSTTVPGLKAAHPPGIDTRWGQRQAALQSDMPSERAKLLHWTDRIDAMIESGKVFQLQGEVRETA